MLRQGLMLGAIGVAVGAVVSLAATRGLGALLYETAPRDPMTFAGTGALLLAMAALATLSSGSRAFSPPTWREVLRAD